MSDNLVMYGSDTSEVNLYVPMPARLLRDRVLTGTEKLLTFQLEGAKVLGQQPGQFVQVSLLGLEEAPISVCSVATKAPTFELCVRKAGKLTQALHTLKEGDQLGFRGPFGKGFPLPLMKGKDLVFIAGGIGLAPLRSLIQHCLAHRDDFGKLTLLYGAKNAGELLFADEFTQWTSSRDFDLRLTVDVGSDGWKGPVGLITKLVGPLCLNRQQTIAVIVGPPVMYPHVIAELKAKGIGPEQIVVSLERHMRCGVGKCGHCMIEDVYYCCCDGPVFMLDQLKHLHEAL